MSSIDMVKIIIVLIAIQYFIFSVHNQGQIIKTISKNKCMHSLINNYCETHFHFLRMVLRSFIRHTVTLLNCFYFSTELKISYGTQQNS